MSPGLHLQDVVTREGKLLFLYKRPGHRVIVDAKGRLIIRPTHIEASVQRDTAGAVHSLIVVNCCSDVHGLDCHRLIVT